MIGLAFASLVTWTVWLAKTVELAAANNLARRRLALLERGFFFGHDIDDNASGESREPTALVWRL